MTDHEVQNYVLSYRLVDGFDYYPGYGRTLGEMVLLSNTLQYSLNGLLPYGGYVVEVEVHLSVVIGSGYSGEQSLLSLDAHIIGSATALNLTHQEGMNYI